MDRIIQKLDVGIATMGFDKESDMVDSLAATPQSLIPTCFTHGAGEYHCNY